MATERIDIVIQERGSRVVQRNLDGIGTSARRTGKEVDYAGRAIAALASAFAVTKLVEYTDTLTTIESRLRLVTDSTAQLNRVQENLFQLAQRTRSSFAATGELYAKLSKATEELALGESKLLEVTETVNKALIVSGSSAAASQAALIQFAQGLSAGALRGEELNSILEQAPRLAQALADGLGKPVGALKKLGEQGELTTERIVKALETQREKLNQEFAQLAPTIGQSFTILNNALTKFVGEGAKTSGVASAIANSIKFVADNLELLTAAVFGFAAAKLAGLLITAAGAAATAGVALNAAAVAAGATPLAARGAAVALGLLGGPVGLITTLLGVGVTAWFAYGAASKAESETASGAVERSTSDIILGLDKQIKKLRERAALAGSFPSLAKDSGEDVQRLAQLQKRIEDFTRGVGEAAKLPEVARQEILRVTLMEYSKLSGKLQDVKAAQEALNRVGQDSAAAKYLEKYATDAEKLAAELKNAKEELGAAFTPELERRIRESFSSKDSSKADPFKDQLESLRERATLLGLNTELERVNAEISLGKFGRLDAAQKAELQTGAALVDAKIRALEVEPEITLARQRTAQIAERALETYSKEANSIADSNQSLREEIELLGANEEARTAIERIRLSSLISAKEEELLNKLNSEGVGAVSMALERQINLLRQRQELLGQKGFKLSDLAAQDASDKVRQLADQADKQLAESISNGLLEGFRKGQSFADVFLRELKSQFAKTVLTPLIQPIVSAGNNFLAGILQSAAGLFGGGPALQNIPALPGDFGAVPMATGTNFVPYDNFPASLHKGEAVVPAEYNPAAGGKSSPPSITVNDNRVFQIDSRSDRAALRQDMVEITKAGQEDMLKQLETSGVIG